MHRDDEPQGQSVQAAKIRRMLRPAALSKDEPLFWSTGRGNDVWAMFCAAITGDLDAIKGLLERDPGLARANFEYRTPLHFAVRENQVAVAACLLERGAPLNLGNPLEMARDRGFAAMQRLLEGVLVGAPGAAPTGEPIAAAIRSRDLARVRALLDADSSLAHAPDERGNRPIHWAAMTRQCAVIDELLARGADINARRGDGARPVQLTNGDYHYRGWRDVPKDVTVTPRDVYAHLRDCGAFVDLCTAAHFGDLARARELLAGDPALANRLSDYVTYYACSGTPLRNAAGAGHLELVRLLLEQGADPNQPEEGIAPRGHALHMAVCNGHIEVVRLLLEKGAYPNVEIESSADTLSAALARKNQPMVELLCAHGAARPLHLLAYAGDVQTAAAVFAANPALADDPDALGNAAGQGHEAFVRLMLKYQPRLPERVAVGVKSRGPQDAIKTRELTELLFAHGMNPSLPDWLRITPLHRFAERGDAENAAIFIERGADLHARDEDFSSTPLGWAARCGKAGVAELLLKRGAKPNLPDDPAWATPLAWATRRGHAEVVGLLKRHGAV